tara:strand:- start:3111 stop:6092 length:2982 start_codon:yes stop_codon:yes gene_type:complete
MKIALFFPLFFIFLLTFGYAQSLEEELAKYSNPSSYDPENIKRLVGEGADVNTLNRWGNPPLTMAVLKKNVELIKFLLSRGANVNLKNPKGFSPLDFAKKSGNNLIIDLLQGGKLETSLKAALASNKYESNKIIDLIKQGAPVNTLSSSGDTALIVAVKKNDARVVEALLEKGANVKLENNEKMTALDIARNLKLKKLINLLIADSPQSLLREGLSQNPFSKDLIRKALKKGANIDSENKRGKTPLLEAVIKKDEDLTKFLLSQGADPYKSNSKGESPFQFAKKKRYKTIINLFENKTNQSIESLLTRNTFNKVSLQERINLGADVNSVGEDGKTAIMFAIEKKDFELIKFLVKKGADLSLKSSAGRNVLDFAANARNSRIKGFILDQLLINLKKFSSINHFNSAKIKTLAEMGTSLKYLNNDGDTLLISAIKNEDQSLFIFLMKKGANILQKNKKGLTVFDVIKTSKLTKLKAFLEKNQLSFELQGYLNHETYNSEKIKELINKGADVNTVNKQRNSILIMAVLKKDVELIKFLLSKGANPEKKNSRGFSALRFSERYPTINELFKTEVSSEEEGEGEEENQPNEPDQEAPQPLTPKERLELQDLFRYADNWKRSKVETPIDFFKMTFSVPFNYLNLKNRKSSLEVDVFKKLKNKLFFFLEVENKKEEKIGGSKLYKIKLTIENRTITKLNLLLDVGTENIPNNYCGMKYRLTVPAKRIVTKELTYLGSQQKGEPKNLFLASTKACPLDLLARKKNHISTKKGKKETIDQCSNLTEGKRRTQEIYDICLEKKVKKEGIYESESPAFNVFSQAKTYGKFKAIDKAIKQCENSPGILIKEIEPKDSFFKCSKNSRELWFCTGKASVFCSLQEQKFLKSNYTRKGFFDDLSFVYEKIKKLYQKALNQELEIGDELEKLYLLAEEQLRQIGELSALIRLENERNKTKVSCHLKERLTDFLNESKKTHACMKNVLFPKLNLNIKETNTFSKTIRFPN